MALFALPHAPAAQQALAEALVQKDLTLVDAALAEGADPQALFLFKDQYRPTPYESVRRIERKMTALGYGIGVAKWSQEFQLALIERGFDPHSKQLEALIRQKDRTRFEAWVNRFSSLTSHFPVTLFQGKFEDDATQMAWLKTWCAACDLHGHRRWTMQDLPYAFQRPHTEDFYAYVLAQSPETPKRVHVLEALSKAVDYSNVQGTAYLLDHTASGQRFQAQPDELQDLFVLALAKHISSTSILHLLADRLDLDQLKAHPDKGPKLQQAIEQSIQHYFDSDVKYLTRYRLLVKKGLWTSEHDVALLEKILTRSGNEPLSNNAYWAWLIKRLPLWSPIEPIQNAAESPDHAHANPVGLTRFVAVVQRTHNGSHWPVHWDQVWQAILTAPDAPEDAWAQAEWAVRELEPETQEHLIGVRRSQDRLNWLDQAMAQSPVARPRQRG